MSYFLLDTYNYAKYNLTYINYWAWEGLKAHFINPRNPLFCFGKDYVNISMQFQLLKLHSLFRLSLAGLHDLLDWGDHFQHSQRSHCHRYSVSLNDCLADGLEKLPPQELGSRRNVGLHVHDMLGQDWHTHPEQVSYIITH